jgi:hypothetical protein
VSKLICTTSFTSLAERAMSFVPVKNGAKLKFLKAEKIWGVTGLLNQKNIHKTAK